MSSMRVTMMTLAFGLSWITVPYAPRMACAETIKELVQDADKKGVLTVGVFKFTFTETSVSGDRTWEQVSVSADGANGIQFTIDPQLRLDSAGEGVAKNATIDITYVVESTTRNIGGARLSADPFSQYAANGANAEVTEVLTGIGDLHVAVPRVNIVAGKIFDGTKSITVIDQGRLYTPPRGGGGNQDEAQLTNITNNFFLVPEPSTLVLISFGSLFFACGRTHKNRATRSTR